MMTITIDIPSELEAVIDAEARRSGLTRDEVVRRILEERLSSAVCGRVIATDLGVKDRSSELLWLQVHSEEYDGRYVALNGSNLVAEGETYKSVTQKARDLGIPDALVVFVEGGDRPPHVGGVY
jgi:hypothetical protein